MSDEENNHGLDDFGAKKGDGHGLDSSDGIDDDHFPDEIPSEDIEVNGGASVTPVPTEAPDTQASGPLDGSTVTDILNDESLSTDEKIERFCDALERIGDRYNWTRTKLVGEGDRGVPDRLGITGDILLSQIPESIHSVIEFLIEAVVSDYLAQTDVLKCDSGPYRTYPDMELLLPVDGGQLVALDIKGARSVTQECKAFLNRVSVGSYGKYFQEPFKDMTGISTPYALYDYHVVLIFVNHRSPEEVIDACDFTVAQKWKAATKHDTGKNTRDYFGSPKTTDAIKTASGPFDSSEEMEAYWRDGDVSVESRKLNDYDDDGEVDDDDGADSGGQSDLPDFGE